MILEEGSVDQDTENDGKKSMKVSYSVEPVKNPSDKYPGQQKKKKVE